MAHGSLPCNVTQAVQCARVCSNLSHVEVTSCSFLRVVTAAVPPPCSMAYAFKALPDTLPHACSIQRMLVWLRSASIVDSEYAADRL